MVRVQPWQRMAARTGQLVAVRGPDGCNSRAADVESRGFCFGL